MRSAKMPSTTHRYIAIPIITLIFLTASIFGQEPPKKTTQTQKIVEQGIAIEFTAEPLVQNVNSIRAAEDVNVRFKITDTTTGTPVKGLGLSAWISTHEGDKTTELAQCREKIQSYLTGSMRA